MLNKRFFSIIVAALLTLFGFYLTLNMSKATVSQKVELLVPERSLKFSGESINEQAKTASQMLNLKRHPGNFIQALVKCKKNETMGVDIKCDELLKDAKNALDLYTSKTTKMSDPYFFKMVSVALSVDESNPYDEVIISSK